MIVSTVQPQNDNILIVSDKFWDKIVCDIFGHFKYLSQVRPRPYSAGYSGSFQSSNRGIIFLYI